ncbi:MAG: Type II secretory pathway, pullulanase PulA and related glycosidase [Lachnospiraceae bacterium]|nr:Type II secretory pathway, pullulanase PulA and related glycosidase [Lachnospiraceae bacterium]
MVRKYKVSAGDPLMSGTYETAKGLNFSVRVPDDLPATLVLTSEDGSREEQVIDLPVGERCGEMASVTLSGRHTSPIAYYYTIDGKRVIDPCARRIVGDVCYTDPGRFNWGDDAAPGIPLSDMIIYKLHVRGFTMSKGSGVLAKGTFRGLAQKIPYLRELGINAVELMPVYEWSDELKGRPGRELKDMPKKNYWGYAEKNCYFAPKQLFSSKEDSVTEFKRTVKALHEAGIEVILEMYFPGDADRLTALSALHFWKMVYHVDGFHVIGAGVPKEALAQDPLLARTKLFFDWIDIGRVYQGIAPKTRHIAICNGYYQSEARRFLKGDAGVSEAFRMTQRANPATHAVVHYVANVDGFTLADAVSYNARHNEDNGENGADGTSDNNSWNCGVEGRTRKLPVIELREKQIKNALAYVLLSQGVPLIYAGDEFGNTQGGNNNAYASDNVVGWVSWRLAKRNKSITEFVKSLITFRKEHGILHTEQELRGNDYRGYGIPDVSWHDTKAWYTDQSAESRSYAVMYNGAYAKKSDGSSDDIIYVCYNAHWECHTFALPQLPSGMLWKTLFSTDEAGLLKAREGFVRWAKEDALRDISVRLERTLAGLESHRELVASEEAERTAKAEQDAEKAGKEAAKTEERPKNGRTFDFEALRKKYIADAEMAVSRIEEAFETSDFPKNQKYIAVPPRSVTVLVGGKTEDGET